MDSNIYYSGGLSELVSKPSELTYSFLKDWFTGNGSLGQAMKLLGLPYARKDLPVIDFHNEELFVNLNSEEETLYSPTILSYKKRSSPNEIPGLRISFKKLFSLGKLANTANLLVKQAKWIQNPESLALIAEKLVNLIPEKTASEGIPEEEILKKDVWPAIIALGYINEFYTQVLSQNLSTPRKIEVNQYADSLTSDKDWFFRSIADQYLVKQGQMTFDEYLKEYGLRADDDYELTCPRWYEIKDVIKKRINSSSATPENKREYRFNEKEKRYLKILARLRLARSAARKKALFHIDALRQSIFLKIKEEEKAPTLVKEKTVVESTHAKRKSGIKTKKKISKREHSANGKGVSVSAGESWGIVLHIHEDTFDVPDNTIGIFPTSGPEYTTLFPKCKGIIFIKGSITSHGAIVAREFGIPAIVDPHANPEDGYKVLLNATTGEWKIIG